MFAVLGVVGVVNVHVRCEFRVLVYDVDDIAWCGRGFVIRGVFLVVTTEMVIGAYLDVIGICALMVRFVVGVVQERGVIAVAVYDSIGKRRFRYRNVFVADY